MLLLKLCACYKGVFSITVEIMVMSLVTMGFWQNGVPFYFSIAAENFNEIEN